MGRLFNCGSYLTLLVKFTSSIQLHILHVNYKNICFRLPETADVSHAINLMSNSSDIQYLELFYTTAALELTLG